MIKKTTPRKALFNLIKKYAYCEGAFRLSSGKLSNYYIDCRKVTLSSQGAYLCAQLILKELISKKVAIVGGPTIGADPIVGALSVISLLKYKKPLKTFLVRKSAKSHGMQRQVEGPPIKKGERVIVIDDVATSGGSLIDAITALEKIGAKVISVIVLVDRNEGAKQRLAQAGYQLISLFNINEFKSRKLCSPKNTLHL